MKICLINNLYEPYAKGGAENVVAAIIGGLLIKNYEVFLITIGRKEKIEVRSWKLEERSKNQEARNFYKVYQIAPWNIFSFLDIDRKTIILRMIWWFFNIFNYSANKEIRRIFLLEKPDVVYTHNMTGISFLVPRLIKKLHIKHLHTLHDIQLIYPSGQLIYSEENNKIFLRKFYEWLTRFLFSSPDVIVSPSRWLLDFYTQRGFFKNSKKIILPNPIDVMSHQSQANSRLSSVVSRQSQITFLFVGRVEKYKGIFVLLEAVKQLTVSNKQLAKFFRVHIVGEGKDMARVREMVEDEEYLPTHYPSAGGEYSRRGCGRRFSPLYKGEKEGVKNILDNEGRFPVELPSLIRRGLGEVVFHGRLNKENLAKIYQQADILILPTLTYENCPNVILEAFAFGLPVVASKIGGIPELVEDGKTGWLFTPGSYDELQAILKNILANQEKLTELKGNCRRQAAVYQPEHYLEKLEKNYK